MILQVPTRLYWILDKNAMESISMANKILQDPIRFYEILDKNAMQSISMANKFLQDPTRFYGILDKNALVSISIANNIFNILRYTRQNCCGIHRKKNKMLQDSAGY